MSTQAIILVLLSALCHASWNLLSKASDNPVSFMVRALLYSAVFYCPLFIAMQFYVGYSWPLVWRVTASGLFAGAYFYALGKAYEGGAVSVAYPIARAFPILVVTWAGLFLGERPSATGLAGIVLVVGGCFILPYSRFCVGPDGFCLRNYFNRTSFWALMAAVFTSIYSVIDKTAAVELPSGMSAAAILAKVNYVYMQNAASLLAVGAMIFFGNIPLGPVPRGKAAAAGLLFLISYSLIMLALATDAVAYVVSFRQLSIVIAAVASMAFLERSFSWPRLCGVLFIFAGVILVGASKPA